MAKIPVGATIARAYGFAFGDFLKILSITWLPWLALSLLSRPLLGSMATLFQNIAAGKFGNTGHLLALLVPLYLLGFYALFMQIAGITQQALGLRTGSPYYYLTFGKPVWRLIGAFFLTILIVIGLYVVVLLTGVVLGAAMTLLAKALNLEGGLKGALTLLTVAVFFAVYCAYIYILFRLTFLLNPIIIAESRIDFRRSWSLGKGNFWRMFLILLAVIIPVMIVFVVAMHLWYGGFPPTLPLGASPDQIAANRAATAAWMAAGMKRTLDYWYIAYPVSGLLTVLMYGLGCGAQSFAYRALVPEAPSAPVSSD